MSKPNTQDPSRYIRTTGMISAKTNLYFPDNSRISFLSKQEAEELSILVRKRNVFARHSWENNFYLNRIAKLANHTVIEVFRRGDPNQINERAEKIAETAEKVTILSSVLVIDKKQFQSKLGLSSKTVDEINVTIGNQCKYIKAKTVSIPKGKGIEIDERFCRRFERCGFHDLYMYCLNDGDLEERIKKSLDWLFESRKEPSRFASVVKSAIALETLLIFNESESLARSLSERAAFILSSSPREREKISSIVKKFYNARSGIVHGSKKRLRSYTPYLLEAMDRLLVLMHLVIVSNPDIWSSTEGLRQWCENERWGSPSNHKIPFPNIYLRNAIALSDKKEKVE